MLSVLRGHDFARRAGEGFVILIFQAVKTAVVTAKADDVSGKCAEGIDARGRFGEIDHHGKGDVLVALAKDGVLVFQHKGADFVRDLLIDVFLDGAVSVFGFARLCVDEIVFHSENFGKLFGDQSFDVFGIVCLCDIGRVKEYALGGIVGGERDAVSVHDRAAGGDDFRFVEHLLQHELFIMSMTDHLKIEDPSDDDQRQHGAYGENDECAKLHFRGLSAQQRSGL